MSKHNYTNPDDTGENMLLPESNTTVDATSRISDDLAEHQIYNSLPQTSSTPPDVTPDDGLTHSQTSRHASTPPLPSITLDVLSTTQSSPTLSSFNTPSGSLYSIPPHHSTTTTTQANDNGQSVTAEAYDFVENIDDIDTIAYYGDLIGETTEEMEDTQISQVDLDPTLTLQTASAVPSESSHKLSGQISTTLSEKPGHNHTNNSNPVPSTSNNPKSSRKEKEKAAKRQKPSTSHQPSPPSIHGVDVHFAFQDMRYEQDKPRRSSKASIDSYGQRDGNDHDDEEEEDDTATQLQQQLQLPIDSHTEEELRRLQQINQDLHILRQIFNDLNEIVLQQGETLDQIETLTDNNRAIVKDTRKEIQKFARRGGWYKRRLVILGALTGFTIVFVPSFLWLFSLPTSLVVSTLVGGGLGAYAGRTIAKFLAIRNARFGILSIIRDHESMEQTIRQQQAAAHQRAQARRLQDQEDDVDLHTLVERHHFAANPSPQGMPPARSRSHRQQQGYQRHALMRMDGNNATSDRSDGNDTVEPASSSIELTSAHPSPPALTRSNSNASDFEQEYRQLLLGTGTASASSSVNDQSHKNSTHDNIPSNQQILTLEQPSTTNSSSSRQPQHQRQMPSPPDRQATSSPTLQTILTPITTSYKTMVSTVSTVASPIALVPSTFRSWSESLGLLPRQKLRETQRGYGI